jgi:hypothetical protein
MIYAEIPDPKTRTMTTRSTGIKSREEAAYRPYRHWRKAGQGHGTEKIVAIFGGNHGDIRTCMAL